MDAYSDFYFRKKIIDELSKFETFVSFASKNTREKYLRGVLYFIEVVINQTISEMEWLVKDAAIYNLIHFGHITESDQPLKELMVKLSPDVQKIRLLERHRKKFAQLRISVEQPRPEQIKVLLLQLKEEIHLIDKYYTEKLHIERNKNINESLQFISSVALTLGYIESNVDFESWKRNKVWIETSGYPKDQFYSLISKESIKNYTLKYFKGESNKEYLTGYTLCLAFFYKEYRIPKRIFNDLLKITTWSALHQKSRACFDGLGGQKIDLMNNLFSYDSTIPFVPFASTEIKNKAELQYATMNRELKVLQGEREGDYPNYRALLQYVFWGMVRTANENNKMAMIEFKAINSRKIDLTNYYYAFYSPVGGLTWNSSHWIVFKDVSAESSWEPRCLFRGVIYRMVRENKQLVNFKSYKISNQLLDHYLTEGSISLRKNLKLTNSLNDAKSMLLELLGIYCIQKELNMSVLWRQKLSLKTDLDGLIIHNETAYILQTKMTLSTDVNAIKKYFEEVESKIRQMKEVAPKRIERLLLVYSGSKKLVQLYKKSNIRVVFISDMIIHNKNIDTNLKPILQRLFEGPFR